MFEFGGNSRKCLLTSHPELAEAAELAMEWQVVDFAIVCGYRGEREQTQAFMTGVSTKRWPNSKHNALDHSGRPCSNAIDFAPWVKFPDGSHGIDWEDTHSFALVAGLIIAAGAELGYKLRWGGDWNRDGRTVNQVLMDYGHIERAI